MREHSKDPKHPVHKRDKHADREAEKGRGEGKEPPSGSIGPGGSALDHLRDEAMEGDRPEDRG
jgi:hypothetical protein